MVLPVGTVTFVFTDIEGSTRLVQQLGSRYDGLLARHSALIRATLATHAGVEVGTEGDSFFCVFPSALDALRAVVAMQRALHEEAWSGPPLRVRIGVHTGEGRLGGDDYVGIDVHRAARIAAAGHGGQILISDATRQLAGAMSGEGLAFRDLGLHRLRDLDEPEHLCQVIAAGLPSDFPAPRSLGLTSGLPATPTSFIGRTDELGRLEALVAGGRVVTLLGPGGAGKTRLGIEAARLVSSRIGIAATFVDLSGLTDGEQVVTEVARSLGVREEPGRMLLDRLAASLADRSALIVLDNCEHVLEGCATLVERLLTRAPSVAILATTRERLAVSAEVVVDVAPLAVPADDDIDVVMASEAARLFIDRAASLGVPVERSDVSARAIGRIVRRLDGIPLAIELAAARLPTFSAAEVAERLDRSLSLLTGGPRTAGPRQRTLRGMIDWSHDLLEVHDQVVLRRTAVFAGGFPFTAAEQVCVGGDDPGGADGLVDRLTALVARSLVVAERATGSTRYRLLETIREYALERLGDADEVDLVGSRHLDWLLGLARTAEPEFVGARQREWFDRLEVEQDNVRAAMAWGMPRDPRRALELGARLYWFWQVRGFAREGRGWLEAGLALPAAGEPDAVRQASTLASGSLAWSVGDSVSARERLSESAAIAEALGDRTGQTIALTILAHALLVDGDTASARDVSQSGVALARAVDDPFVLGRALGTLADVARHEGADAEVVAVAGEALVAFASVGMDEGIAFNLAYQADGLRARDPERARAQLLDAASRFMRIDHPGGLYVALLALAEPPPAEPDDLGLLLGALDRLHERSGIVGMPRDRARAERLERAAAATLEPARMAAVRARGRDLPLERIVALAVGEGVAGR